MSEKKKRQSTHGRYKPVEVIDGKVTCKKCLTTQPVANFYLTTKGKVQGECKECTKARAGRTRLKDYEKYSAKWRESCRSPENRKRRLEWGSRQRIDAPLKYTARTAVAYAIRTGRMMRKPCEFCGSLRSQAHHDDYTRPFDVMWLCQAHHAGRHAFLKYFGISTTHSMERAA